MPDQETGSTAELDIDPAALRRFSSAANVHARSLAVLSSDLRLAEGALGDFQEASKLAARLNAQTDVVVERCRNAGAALTSLAQAANLAGGLAKESDERFAHTMHQIGAALDKADSHITKPAHAGAPQL